MTIKDFIIARLQVFFFLVTLILIASAVLGGMVDPDRELHYYDLFSPVIISGLCILPTCLTYYKKEPTLRQYLFRSALELAVIEAIVLFIISPPESMKSEPLNFYLLLGASVFIIYVLVELIMWLKKYLESRKLTDDLKRLQASESIV